MTLSRWLADAERRLLAAGVEPERMEAQLLAAHVLLVDRSWVLAHPSHPFPALAGEAVLQRREAREPLAYILGRREFYGRRFAVRSGVLVPRQETETLVEVALEEGTRNEGRGKSDEGRGKSDQERATQEEIGADRARPSDGSDRSDRSNTTYPAGLHATPHTPHPTPYTPHTTPSANRVLDLGTGSGILAITLKLERPGWDVSASDVSSDALEVALENARTLGADVRFVLSDGFHAFGDERFDLIVTNPPYVAAEASLEPEVARFEPHVALFSGETGLEFYRMLARETSARLAKGGLLITEVGDGIADEVAGLFDAAGWEVLRREKDLLGIERCLVLAPNPSL